MVQILLRSLISILNEYPDFTSAELATIMVNKLQISEVPDTGLDFPVFRIKGIEND